MAQPGLVYYVSLTPDFFAFYTDAELAKVELVERKLLKAAELLRAEGLPAAELKRAEAKNIGRRKIARQDLGGFAMPTALDELYGLGYGHPDTEDAQFEAVTLEQVKAAANQYLRSEVCVVAVVKPES